MADLSGDPTVFYPPEEWTKAMDHAGLTTSTSIDYIVDMEKDDAGYWSISLNLPGGNYRYHYLVNGEKKLDPANMPMSNGAYSLGRCFALVGFDKEKQPIDRSFIMPVETDKAGNVSFVECPTNGLLEAETQFVGVYLPANYDSDREEPYNTLYMVHGTGGNEIAWFQFGCINNIVDNAVVNGTTDEFVVVSINNTAFGDENKVWDMEKCTDNFLNNIIPFIENTYNVSENPEGRALVGLSQGSEFVSKLYLQHPTELGYFGMLSGGPNVMYISDMKEEEFSLADYNNCSGVPKIFVGTGRMDGENILEAVDELKTFLDSENIEYTYVETDTGHDWFCWSELVHIFIRDVLWK